MTNTLPPTLGTTLPPPTLDVTPTFVTANAETPQQQTQALTITPVPGTDTVEVFDSTPTPSPFPTVADVVIPATVSIQSIPTASLDFSSRIYTLGPGGAGAFVGVGGVSNPTLLVQNPVFPGQFIATDPVGSLFLVDNGVSQGIPGKMFTGATSASENNGFVSGAAWSPDGTKAAFIVDAYSKRGASATADDGVWVYNAGQFVGDGNQLLRHCPGGDADPYQCTAVARNDFPYYYRTISLVWSPDSQRVLATILYIDEGGNQRRGLMVLTPGQSNPGVRPPILRYEYGSWTGDGRLVVSGGDVGYRPALGVLNADGSGQTGYLDGFVLRDAVASGGGLIAVGRQGDGNGAFRLYDQTGTPRSPEIGFAPPIEVKWNRQNTAAYVKTSDNRHYIVNVDGAVQEISEQVAGAQFVNWGILPPTSTGGTVPAAGYIPPGVVENSRYQAGAQLRINSTSGTLNLRQQPSMQAAILGTYPNGAYVAILAGPVNADGVEWWQVKTADGLQGWMAGQINGNDVFIP
jgi:hypothetical protein